MTKIALKPNVFQRDCQCLKSRKIATRCTDFGFQKLISGASTWVVKSSKGLVFWQGDSALWKLIPMDFELWKLSPMDFGLKVLQKWSIQSYQLLLDKASATAQFLSIFAVMYLCLPHLKDIP